MKRQRYFPRTKGGQPGWFGSFAAQLSHANETLGFPDADIAAAIADAGFLAYVTGAWIAMVRGFGPTCTLALKAAMEGTGDEAVTLPTFTVAPVPAGVVPVPPGAYTRLTKFVQRIKASANYTSVVGILLGIIGSEDATAHPVPTFTLRVERGAKWERVRIDCERYGNKGVYIETMRGTGGWEPLPIALTSPVYDARPLLDPATPEVRKYRMCFYGPTGLIGEWTGIASVTVSP
jgi:hypothetical protein